ncbi:unnamed protein product [Caenorhabditis bovis]|uniref:Uncharacterized protein n=1 Tax=Caenorhabditis bovis TaxID=2654633 RepID=A0A8S1F9J5_9PELO|nr:unnamed protein product [Caenorhabditis bovis]
MATFASLELSEKLADGAEDPNEEEEVKKSGPKRLAADEVSSIFTLKNEMYKKKNTIIKSNFDKGYVAGKSSLLTTKKEEKEAQEKESRERRARIEKNEQGWKREEEEAFNRAQEKLKEKAKLYERLAEGHVVIEQSDNQPVEFMVDFSSKKRQVEEEKKAERDRYREIEEGPSTSFGRAPVPERFHHNEEQRVYGVSHIRLSANEEKRREEIQNLLNFSKKTNEERKKLKIEKDEKEAKRREKINKLRIKKGLPPYPSPEPEPNLDEIPIPEPHETPEQRHARLMKSNREWDRGKGLYTQWIEKQRDDRDDEFRPPDSYFK